MTTQHSNTGDFGCDEARPLVPGYLDGELSEARAGLLRKHLLDCAACRTSAQDGKALSRWFTAPERLEFAPPTGFAARVARRAFAGDVGTGDTGGTGFESQREATEAGAREGGRMLQFVLTLTAAAAAVMLVAAVALRDQNLPADGRLRASNQPASKDEVILRLDELNRREAQAAAAAAAGLRKEP